MIGRLIAFVKDWMLLLAMAAGAAVYLIYINIPSLSGFGPALYDAVTALQPVLLFILLFLAFCRISPKDMRPRKWQLWLLLFQAAVFFGLVSLDVFLRDGHWKVMLESAMLMFICPTATAAAVVTGKLGGDMPGITTYMILVNLVTAISVPLAVPLVHPAEGISFIVSFFLF